MKGWLKIRSYDRELALSTKHFMRKALDYGRNAKGLLTFCIAEAKRLGLRIVEKIESKLRWSKMSTTFYNEIRVAFGFWGRGWSDTRRAVTLVHELMHALQWRFYGHAGFALRYGTSARFRWAVEMQCYRFGVLVKRALGYSETSIRNANKHRATAMRKPYRLRSLRWADLSKYTPAVLNAAA